MSVPNVDDLARRGHGFLQEFRAFIMRGNVVDLAVGVVIGAAFGKIVSALVDQVIMPPIGMLTSKADFSTLEWVLRPEDAAHGVKKVAIGYGAFLNTVIQFLIIAFVVFVVVKLVNRLREKEAEKPTLPPAPTPTEKLLEEIRDELRSRGSPSRDQA
jgi:large conductance mechanosensitive channel